MRTGILVNARLGSTRLKRKHLLPVRNQPIILYLLKRIITEFTGEVEQGQVKVILATADEPENRDFEAVIPETVSVYYGSVNNIPLRHLQTAQNYALDYIVSVDGDDILCSVNAMRSVYTALNQNCHYVKTTNLPFGMNSWGYSVDFLKQSLQKHVSDVLETGWGRIFAPEELMELNISSSLNDNLLRFTLDYQQDYEFFKTLINTIGDNIYRANDEEIVQTVVSKHLYIINEAISKEYWENFYRHVEKEKHA